MREDSNLFQIAHDYIEAFGYNILPLFNKTPAVHKWEKWHLEKMNILDLNNFEWEKVTGIGGIHGINNLRAFDFDKVEKPEIVDLFLKELGLPLNYGWVVKSGSGKGYHIWFCCEDKDNDLETKAYYKYNLKDENFCDHIELRWKNCQTVLPPSKHESGSNYSFQYVKSGLPSEKPIKIELEKIKNVLNRFCVIVEKKEVLKNSSVKAVNFDPEKLRFAADILEQNINCYEDWFTCGMALASIGEAGRDYFIKLSFGNQKYNDTLENINKKYDGFLKDYDGRISLGSYFEIAKKYGYVVPQVFWKEQEQGMIIKQDKLIQVLAEAGFGKMLIGEKSIYIKIEDMIVREVLPVKIKDFCIDLINKNARDEDKPRVRERLMNISSQMYSDSKLEFLPTLELNFYKDTKDEAFFYFNNCYVKVTKEKIEVNTYKNLDRYVWAKQICKKEYYNTVLRSDFEVFISNICRNDEKRINALRSAIGYLLHSYKDPSIPKAIVLLDEKISEDAYGRSGKGLVVNAIGQLKNVLKMDMRNHKLDKSFAFQSVSIDTQIVFMDDLTPRFPLERLFSVLAEGITIEQKNIKEYRIEYEDSPKFVLSTNYSLKGDDDSSLDRQFIIEFSDHYNKKNKPINEFNKLFFKGWEQDEWNAFFSYMLNCCKYFLVNGLVEYKYVNLEFKKLIDSTCQEFADFIMELKHDYKYDKKEVFKNFIAENEDYEKSLRQNTFTKWLKIYCKLYGLNYLQHKSDSKYSFILSKGKNG